MPGQPPLALFLVAPATAQEDVAPTLVSIQEFEVAPANLYGSRSLEAALEAADAGQRWGEIMEERYAMLRDMESGLYMFRGDLSYLPEESM